MRHLINLGLITLASLFALSSQATLVLTPADCVPGTCWTSNQTNNPDASDIESLVGAPTGSLNDFVYKAEDGGIDEGSLKTSYDATFTPTGDPDSALIEYIGGLVADCVTSSCYLSVKDGNNTPSLYVFDISGWDGLTDIQLSDFWPGPGAISNVAIWGNVMSVPAPGVLGLLGLGLLLLSSARRRHTVA